MSPVDIALEVKKAASNYVGDWWEDNYCGACAVVSTAFKIAANTLGIKMKQAVGIAFPQEESEHYDVVLYHKPFVSERRYVSKVFNDSAIVNHCWNVDDEGNIWDLTSDQFCSDMDWYENYGLYLTQYSEEDNRRFELYWPYYVNPSMFSFKSWPQEQRPYMYRVKSLLKWLPEKEQERALKMLAKFRAR